MAAGHDNAFWGHLGLKCPWEDKTRWWPITARTRSALYDASDQEWIAAPTLANRLVVFRVDYIERMTLLDDGCAQPDDWELGNTPYQGLPARFYRALGDWAGAELGNGTAFEATCPRELKRAVERHLEEEGLKEDPEQVLALVQETKITLRSGATYSYLAEPEQLGALVDHLGGDGNSVNDDMRSVVLSKSGETLEIIYPLSQLAIIEVPLTEIGAVNDE